MAINGDIVDPVARERADTAYEMARSSWEYSGQCLRAVESLRLEMKHEFAELRGLMGQRPPPAASTSIPPIQSLGKASATGSHFVIEAEQYARALTPLANELTDVRDQLAELARAKRDQEILAGDALLRAQAAEKRSERLRGWLAVVVALAGVAVAILAAVRH
jgi:hypothetical protein